MFIPEKCIVQGKKMFLHKSGHSFELAFQGTYEPLEYNFLKTLNLDGTVALDVGSCIGYYSLLLSDLAGKGKVLAFEPENGNFGLLKKNIEVNNLTNIQAYNVAVGNKNGAVFLKKGRSPGEHSVYDDAQKDKDVSVEIVRIDDFLKEKKISLSDVSYVKIDVEGYEFEVLRGMTEVISESSDLIIQFEFAPQHLEEHDCSLHELVDFIRNNNINVSYWDLHKGTLEKVSNLDWLLQFDTVEDFRLGIKYSRNLICSKKIV